MKATRITYYERFNIEQEDECGEPKAKQRKLNPQSTVKRVLFTGLTGATVHRLRQNVVKLKGELAKGSSVFVCLCLFVWECLKLKT